MLEVEREKLAMALAGGGVSNSMASSRAPAVSSIVLAALLAACHPSGQLGASADAPFAALPPVSASAPLVAAPALDALPPAPPAPIGHVADRTQGFAFAERAYAMGDAFGEAPPDYTYGVGGVRPWVWLGRDNSERVAETTARGERYYYYEAGSNRPFYVQDAGDGYGYDNGALVAVYGPSGQQLTEDEAAQRAEDAGRYLARGRALYDASRQIQRKAVGEADWRARRAEIEAQQQAWAREQQQDPDWRAYHAQYDAQEQAHWAAERLTRRAWAAEVDQSMHDRVDAAREWREAGRADQGAPPTLLMARYAAAPPAAPPIGPQPYGRLAVAPQGLGRPGLPTSGSPGFEPGRRGRYLAAQQAAARQAAAQQATAARQQLAAIPQALDPQQAQNSTEGLSAAEQAQLPAHLSGGKGDEPARQTGAL